MLRGMDACRFRSKAHPQDLKVRKSCVAHFEVPGKKFFGAQSPLVLLSGVTNLNHLHQHNSG